MKAIMLWPMFVGVAMAIVLVAPLPAASRQEKAVTMVAAFGVHVVCWQAVRTIFFTCSATRQLEPSGYNLHSTDLNCELMR